MFIWAWWYTPLIPAFGKLRQEARGFNATLDYMCAQAHRHENGHVQDTGLLLPTFVPPSDHRIFRAVSDCSTNA